jgi:hypothetical protein
MHMLCSEVLCAFAVELLVQPILLSGLLQLLQQLIVRNLTFTSVCV